MQGELGGVRKGWQTCLGDSEGRLLPVCRGQQITSSLAGISRRCKSDCVSCTQNRHTGYGDSRAALQAQVPGRNEPRVSAARDVTGYRCRTTRCRSQRNNTVFQKAREATPVTGNSEWTSLMPSSSKWRISVSKRKRVKPLEGRSPMKSRFGRTCLAHPGTIGGSFSPGNYVPPSAHRSIYLLLRRADV